MRKWRTLAVVLFLALAAPVAGLAAKDKLIVLKGGQKAVVVESKIYFLDASGKRVFAPPGKYQTPDGKTIFIIDGNANFQRIHERW